MGSVYRNVDEGQAIEDRSTPTGGLARPWGISPHEDSHYAWSTSRGAGHDFVAGREAIGSCIDMSRAGETLPDPYPLPHVRTEDLERRSCTPARVRSGASNRLAVTLAVTGAELTSLASRGAPISAL